MLRYIIVFIVVYAAHLNVMDGLKQIYPPGKGEVWPKPQHHIKNDTFLIFDPEHLYIKVNDTDCPLLTSIIARYTRILSEQSVPLRWSSSHAYARADRRIEQLWIELMAPCDDYPQFGMDESYTLKVDEISRLKSISVWGILRGLQTFSHMLFFTNDYTDRIQITAAKIFDFPRYSHRGLLLDTSRHFISLKNILLTLDAMEMNKMNVFHWHIVDDESFPYQSEKIPALSVYGAYDPTMVYTKKDIELIVQYARERGIRVLPEFDVPGHTRSWGEAFPMILTMCYRDGKLTSGPMDPTNNATYELLQELISEVQELFPDNYYHIGGDEVNPHCWHSNAAVLEYLQQNRNIDLYQLFISKVISLLGERSHPIVWEEVFHSKVSLPDDTLVQLWKEWKGSHTKDNLHKVLQAGYKALVSSPYYLDSLQTWEDYYRDPNALLMNASLADSIVGGEACMWTENTDNTNIMTRVWPQASAVAEVLWSSSLDLDEARPRLEEHVCRMIRRGISAQPPNGPGFCIV